MKLQFLGEEFEGSFRLSQHTDKTVDVYLNATREEVRDILREDEYGIRIGVVSSKEIYYWPSYITHTNMGDFILHKQFNLKLTYDKKTNTIHDYEAEDHEYAHPNEYAQIANIGLLKQIKYKIDDAFNYPEYADYMELDSEAEPKLYQGVTSQFHEHKITRFKDFYLKEDIKYPSHDNLDEYVSLAIEAIKDMADNQVVWRGFNAGKHPAKVIIVDNSDRKQFRGQILASGSNIVKDILSKLGVKNPVFASHSISKVKFFGEPCIMLPFPTETFNTYQSPVVEDLAHLQDESPKSLGIGSSNTIIEKLDKKSYEDTLNKIVASYKQTLDLDKNEIIFDINKYIIIRASFILLKVDRRIPTSCLTLDSNNSDSLITITFPLITSISPHPLGN